MAAVLMARDHARIRHSIWSDPDFLRLTEGAQRAYMLALSQPGLNYCGVVPFTLRRWAKLAADSQQKRLREAIRALEVARFVLVDEDSEELLIRSFIRNDGILESPNVCIAAVKAFPALISPLLRGVFLVELHRLNESPQHAGWDKGWANLSPLLGVKVPEGLPEGFHQHYCKGWGESRARACPCPCPDPDPVPDAADDVDTNGPGHDAFRRAREQLEGRTA